MRNVWTCVIVLFLCLLVQGIAAISVGNIAITPSGSLISGQTQVRSTFIIEFPASGGKTFDDTNSLQLSSEMDNPTWTYSLVLDEVENPSKTEVGQNVNINGWLLSYPAKRELSMKVTMEGTAPVVDGTSEKIVIAVRELDSKGKAIASSEVIKKAPVINPSQVKESIQQAREKLASLRSEIDAAMIPGLDLSAVEAKYNEANTAIQNADSTSDYSRAQSYLNTAISAISDAQTLLSEFTIQKTLNDADAKIGEISSLITDFRVNKSMGSDPRLTPILLAHDNAAGLVSEARDALSAKNYDQARTKATDAAAKADEALAEAYTLKQQVESNPLSGAASMAAGILVGGMVIIVAVVVIAIVAIVGYLLFRRRRKWDELG